MSLEIITTDSISSEMDTVKEEFKKHEKALEQSSQTALKQSKLLKEHEGKIKEDRVKIQNLVDSVHSVTKVVAERFAETDSRMEQLEKENKILKYAVGASAVFDFALLFVFLVVTSGY